MCCHTEEEVADQTFYLTHSTLTLGQIVPALTLKHQVPGRVATGVPVTDMTQPGARSTAKVGIEPRSATLGMGVKFCSSVNGLSYKKTGT